MSLDTLHNADDTRAVLYDNTTDFPLELEVFGAWPEEGVSASGMAAKFTADAQAHFDRDDIRTVPPMELARYQGEWMPR